MIRLIRSELLKIRTTHTWWILALGAFLATALAFAVWALDTHQQLNPQELYFPPDYPAEERAREQAAEDARNAEARSVAGLAKLAANLYTSGQFLGLMFVMLIGILMITNEFYHQTATATFLTTPHRSKVILGKLLTATLIGLGFWLFTTVINLVAGTIFFSSEGVSNSLGEWETTRALLLNLLAYALWTIFGIGLGVLIRSQIGATITASVTYTIGTFVVLNILQILYFTVLERDWVLQIAVLIPPLASNHMITGLELGEDVQPWPRWVGAVVLIGWAVVAGGIGTMITRRRDIS